eukprot:2822027-Rhodomonas_salina.1
MLTSSGGKSKTSSASAAAASAAASAAPSDASAGAAPSSAGAASALPAAAEVPARSGWGIMAASEPLIWKRISVIGEPGLTSATSMYSAGIPRAFASLVRCAFAKAMRSSSELKAMSNLTSITSDFSSPSGGFDVGSISCTSCRRYSSYAHS